MSERGSVRLRVRTRVRVKVREGDGEGDGEGEGEGESKGQFPLAKKASELRNISDRKFLGMRIFLSTRDFCQKIFFSARNKKS